MILENFPYISGYLFGFLSWFTTENVTLIGGTLAIIKWLYETQKQRRWETNKYLIERLDEFQNKNSTITVHDILDYNSGISIQIDSDEEKEEIINDEIVIDALTTHDKKQSFTDVDVFIRDTFDEYFDNLSQLILMSECGLIDKKNLKFLLKYYIDIMNGKSNRKNDIYVLQIKNYLKFYNYDLVLKFIK